MPRFYNSLTKTVEEFSPAAPPRVGMYTCGPTVHDFAHVATVGIPLLHQWSATQLGGKNAS